MFVTLLSIAAAYLLGLALLGYVCVLWLLQFECKRRNVSLLVRSCLTTVHYAFGMLGMVLVPTLVFGKLNSYMTTEAGLAFGFTGVLVLGLIFLVLRELNRKLRTLDSLD